MWTTAKASLNSSFAAVVEAVVGGSDVQPRAACEATGGGIDGPDALALEKAVRTATSTTAGRLPEEEIQYIIDAADDPERQPHIEAALAHRLQQCDSSLMIVAAAKALVLLHRLLLAGHAVLLESAVLAELPHMLSSVDELDAETEHVRCCIVYLAHLIDSPAASRLRDPAACGAALAQLPPPELAETLSPMLVLTDKALLCAATEPPTCAALQSLWMAVVEDSLCLFRTGYSCIPQGRRTYAKRVAGPGVPYLQEAQQFPSLAQLIRTA